MLLIFQKQKKIIIIALLSAAFVIPLAAYFSVFHGELSNSHGRWGEFGSYLSGVYGSLALVIVSYTTYLTREQFRRQNEDSVFFHLFDSLQNRIEATSLDVNGTILSGQKCLKHIVQSFYKELSTETVEIARMLLVDEPESINNTQLIKLLEAVKGPVVFDNVSKEISDFVTDIKSAGEYNDRWERIKDYIGSRGGEGEKVREALRSLGSVYFYEIPFQTRQKHYHAALYRISVEHGELLDTYLNTMLLVADLACRSVNRLIYEKYIQSQLTRHEVIVLFYVLVGQSRPIAGQRVIHDIGIFNRLHSFDCQSLMIDMPNTELIELEIRELFTK